MGRSWSIPPPPFTCRDVPPRHADGCCSCPLWHRKTMEKQVTAIIWRVMAECQEKSMWLRKRASGECDKSRPWAAKLVSGSVRVQRRRYGVHGHAVPDKLYSLHGG